MLSRGGLQKLSNSLHTSSVQVKNLYVDGVLIVNGQEITGSLNQGGDTSVVDTSVVEAELEDHDVRLIDHGTRLIVTEEAVSRAISGLQIIETGSVDHELRLIDHEIRLLANEASLVDHETRLVATENITTVRVTRSEIAGVVPASGGVANITFKTKATFEDDVSVTGQATFEDDVIVTGDKITCKEIVGTVFAPYTQETVKFPSVNHFTGFSHFTDIAVGALSRGLWYNSGNMNTQEIKAVGIFNFASTNWTTPTGWWFAANGALYTTNFFALQGYSTWSDDRIKSRTKSITNATDTLSKLMPVTYEKHHDFRVPEGVEDSDLTGVEHHTESGFEAQAVRAIPELNHLVSQSLNEVNDLYALDYNQLIPFLVKSIQELKARIEVLEN